MENKQITAHRDAMEGSRITAEISLTKQQWSLLTAFTSQGVCLLPKQCWDVADEIEKEIENGLSKALEEN